MATSRNVFDQFDAPDSGNVFDQFDQQSETKTESGDGLLKSYYGATLEPAAHLVTGLVAGPLSGLAGIAQGIKNQVSSGMSAGDRVLQASESLTYQPRTNVGKAMVGVIDYPFQKLAQAGDAVGDWVNAPDAAKPKISATAANYGLDPIVTQARSPEERAAEGALFNTAIQSLPSLLLRGRGNPAEVVPNGLRSPGVGRDVVAGEKPAPTVPSTAAQRPSGLASLSDIPTKQALREAADAAYKRADEAGVIVKPESFDAFKEKVVSQMQREGIDPTLHPDATAALKRLSEASGEQSLKKLETLRRVANDAEGSIKPADRRLAGQIVDEIDSYIDSLSEADVVAGDATKAKALKEARNFYSRSKKAEELDQLMNRAELSAPNFSGSGMENAIRTEFRSLAKNERRMRRFTREEREAIRRVAKGGPVENALRMLGKLAPTGVVSGALSSGAGFMTGGPVGAVALPATGLAARYAATRMTLKNADIANQLVRRGPLASPELTPAPPHGVLAP
jgi:hypothetical protein